MIVVSLPVDSCVALVPVLAVTLVSPVARGYVGLATTIVLLLLVLGMSEIGPAEGLAGLEGLRCGLEGGCAGSKSSLLAVGNVHVLLSLARKVLVLSGRIILPGV